MFFKKKVKKENTEEKSDSFYRPGLLFVEMMFEDTPNFHIENILNDMRNTIGKVELMTSSKDMTAFIFNDYPLKYKDANIPSQCILFSIVNKVEHENLVSSLQQTRDWNELEEVVERCKYKVAFSDFMPNHYDIHTRLSLFNSALKVILENEDCKALHFLNSQRIINPCEYIDRVSKGDNLAGAFNVRFFNIQDSEDMLMDTLGLNVFGLPDVQCHFKGVDPNEIARVIYNTGYYIYDKGDIIDDGNTIQGAKKEDKWKCQHEESLVEPKRVVVDINPGFPYAAGGR